MSQKTVPPIIKANDIIIRMESGSRKSSSSAGSEKMERVCGR